MDALQKIQGRSRLDVFNHLKKEKTLIGMKMQPLDYEEMTRITDIQTKGQTHFFIISPSKKFDDVAAHLETQHIEFKFNSKDGMHYVFSSAGSEILDKEIWIPFPEFIEQIQRRRDYRLGFQKGTILHFKMDSVHYKMDLMNLSMGGACGEIKAIKDETKKLPIFKSGDNLVDVKIVSSSQEGNLEVHVKKASITRVDDLKNSNGYSLGLQFMDIEKEEVHKLKKMIYDLQRYFLQRRLNPDL